MKTNVTKLRPLLLLTLLFMLTNCQEDLYEIKQDNKQINAEQRVFFLTGKEAKERKQKFVANLSKNGGAAMAKLADKIAGTAGSGSSLRTMTDVEPYIDESAVVKVISYNGYTNYTFRVNLPDAANDKFYNLIFSQNGESDVTTLITYSLETEFAKTYLLNGDFSKFTGSIQFETLGHSTRFPCPEAYRPPKGIPISGGSGPGGGGGSGGGGESGGGESGGGESGGGSQTIPLPVSVDPPADTGHFETPIQYESIGIAPITIPGPTATTIPLPGTGSGTGTGNGTINFPPIRLYGVVIPGIVASEDPCEDPDIIAILEPVNPVRAFEKNCEELDNFIKRSTNLASMKDVELNSFDSDEDGYSYSFNNAPKALLKAPGNILVKVPAGGQIYGASHDHPSSSTTDYMPMFSIADIYSLGLMASKYVATPEHPKQYNKFIFTLSVSYGSNDKYTYALKIDDWLQFAVFVNEYYASEAFRIENEKKLRNLYSTLKITDGPSAFLKVLLKYMNDKNIKGVSIYKADDKEFSSWSRLAYDPINNNFSEIPCK